MTDETPEPAPPTAGEIRKALDEMGNPWTVDPDISDDEPLPDFPRGGEMPDELPIARSAFVSEEADLTDILRQHPPTNPFLRARWEELGLAPADEQGTERATVEENRDREEDRG